MTLSKATLKIVILFLLISYPFYGQKFNEDIEDEINNILEDEYFKSTSLAVSIYDLTSKKELYNLNEKLLLHPASNMKIITTIAALDFLDSTDFFSTSLYHTGIIMDSVCYGDLIVVGGFDPDFTSKDLDTLVFSLKNYGINEIRGNIYGDVSNMDSLFWGNGWMWDDDPSTDFPYMTPLIINDGIIKIAYEPGEIGKPANVSLVEETNYFDMSNTSITTKEDTSEFEITRDWMQRGNEILIKGDISYRAYPDTTEINIVSPEYYFLHLLKEKIKQNSIEFFGRLDTLTLPEYSKIIYKKERTFSDVMNNLNKESDNLSAEMTLRLLGLKYYDKPSSASKGVQVIDSLIARAGLNYKDYKIVDGSGVSHYNLVSTQLLSELLKYVYYKSPEKYNSLFNSFPIAGIDGTLENRMNGTKAFNNVHAKTGSLSGVSTLSGYLNSADNHKIVFSIFTQNFVGSSKIVRRSQDRICKFLSELKINN